jgi:serine/threonine protein phosphatase PrpC
MDKKEIIVRAVAVTDPGGRRINEDAVYACQEVEADRIAARGRLYIVADGTGAQEGGQTASSMATAIISEHFYDDNSSDIGESLRTAVTTAHEALYELAQKVAAWAEMSTTIVAAVLHQGQLVVAHVGDSRAYLVRGGQARLVTRDHVWLEDDENYGALTRWLGGSRHPSVKVDLTIEALQEGDTIVLCSDGLTDVVDGPEIGTVASKSRPQIAARQLIELANRRRTGDNVSAAVVQYGGKGSGSPMRRWVWIGAGATALVALLIAVVLVLTGDAERGAVDGEAVTDEPAATATATLPARIQVAETPTAAPTEIAPSVGETREPTSTPAPSVYTPTPRPTSVAGPTGEAIPARQAVPALVAPPQGARDQVNPITFQWRGSLSAGQVYQVTAYHPESGERVDSGPLAVPAWSTHLPAERHGEWRWTVSVIQEGRVVATSDEGMFWFNPIPVGPGGPSDEEGAPGGRD